LALSVVIVIAYPTTLVKIAMYSKMMMVILDCNGIGILTKYTIIL